MSYKLTKRINNGYRCCCHRSWETDPVYFDDLEDALAEVPMTHESGDWEIEEISVVDEETGEVVAYGELQWWGGRNKRYRIQRWTGHKGTGKDCKPFEEIRGGNPGESWTQLIARLEREDREAKLASKVKEVEKLNKEIKELKKE